MFPVQSAQDLYDLVADLRGLFQPPKDIAHVPSPLIRALTVPLRRLYIEHAMRQIPIMFRVLWSSTLGVSSLSATRRVFVAFLHAPDFPCSEGK